MIVVTAVTVATAITIAVIVVATAAKVGVVRTIAHKARLPLNNLKPHKSSLLKQLSLGEISHAFDAQKNQVPQESPRITLW
jgi:hypothetical protein